MNKYLLLLLAFIFITSCNSIRQNEFIEKIGYVKSNNETFNEIKNGKFQTLKDSKIGYQNGKYWFKVELNKTVKPEQELFFQVEEPSISSLTIFNENGFIKEVKSAKGNTVITLNINHTNSDYYFIQAEFKRQIHFPLSIYNAHQFYKSQEKKNIGFGLYYGIAIMVFILNIIFYISLKDKTFLYYSIFMGSINLSFTGFDGVLYLFFDQSIFDDYLLIFHLLIQIFGALFASNFLNLHLFYPKLDRFGKLFIIIPAIFYACFYISNNFLYFAIADFFGLLVLAYYWLMGILMIKKEEFAKFFVIGYCMALFAALFYLTPLNFGFSTISTTFNQLKVGNIIEMIILTYAITFRVKKLQEENNNYRNDLQLYLNEIYGLKEQLKNSSKLDKEKTLSSKIEELKNEHNLTERELDILIQITKGASNKQISENLFISVNTVKYHTKKLYEKLDVKKRTEIAPIVFN